MMKLLVACTVAVMTFAAAPQALQATGARCPLQNATLHGTYLVAGSGTIVGLGPVSAVGEVTFDGQGNSTATYTVSVNGTIHKGVTVTGTYTVNLDCTATHAESDGSHYNYVVTPDGNKVWWIETDAGVVLSGTEVRLQPVDSEEAARMGSSDKDGLQVPLDGAASSESLAVVLLALKKQQETGPCHGMAMPS
jgi:hypothetical protein